MNKIILVLIVFTFIIYPQNIRNNQININNKKYSTKNLTSKDTLSNTNNISLNISNGSGESNGSSWINLISIVVGIVGIFVAIGLAIGGQNFYSLKKLKKEFNAEKNDINNAQLEAIAKFKELDQKYKEIINKYNIISNEIMEWYETYKTVPGEKDKEDFYIRGIVNRISDIQPIQVLLSALRIVANMSIIEAVPNIDQLLVSDKVDEETKSFANVIKMNLLKIK